MDEIEQYRYEQARAWLEHVAKLKHAVGASRDMLEMFEGLAEQARAIDYSRVRVSGGQQADRMAEAVARLDEAHMQWAANLAAYTDEATDAAARIDRLEDKTEARALLAHYVDGRPWERVCIMLDYSYDGIMHVRQRAVLHMYDHMPTEWRDPVHRAL